MDGRRFTNKLCPKFLKDISNSYERLEEVGHLRRIVSLPLMVFIKRGVISAFHWMIIIITTDSHQFENLLKALKKLCDTFILELDGLFFTKAVLKKDSMINEVEINGKVSIIKRNGRCG